MTVPALRTRPLPGVRVDPRPPALDDLEPRMDVAGFVGFAATGPVDVPVPVEDHGRLVDVFGPEFTLLVDAATGRPEHAHLVPAVTAFLRSGGRRCWVVRVTGRHDAPPYGSLAHRRTIAVPGLAWLTGGRLEPARVAARSVGSWADDLRVEGQLRERPVAVTGVASAQPGQVTCRVAAGPPLGAGDLLRLEQPDGTTLLCFVATVTTHDPEDGAGPDRAVVASDAVVVDGNGRLLAGTPVADPPVRAVVLTLRLRARPGTGPLRDLDELGLHPRHPRFLGTLPTDEELYRLDDDCDRPGPTPARPALWAEVTAPRFPLAGTARDRAYYPIAVVDPGSPPDAPDTPGPSPLHRDGLASTDPAAPALDPALTGLSPVALAAAADHLRWRAGAPRPLLGAHALYGIDEVTLLCAPDAVHRSWSTPEPLATPDPPPHQPYPRPPGPDPDGPFRDCGRAAELAAPTGVRATAEPAAVGWDPVPGAEDYVLEETTDAASWAAAVEIGSGPATAVALDRPPGLWFYRVRAVAGPNSSDWSAGVTVAVPGPPAWRLADPSAGPDDALVAVHRDLLTLAAARGDVLAVLVLPVHAREPAAAAHADALRAGRDERVLSFGALYHPWVLRAPSPDVAAGDALRSIPPDGPVAGVAAARARLRGAWVAPANEPLSDVLGLTPLVPDRRLLQDAHVNALVQEATGTCCLGADTLSADPDLREVAVRRLLALLRRTVLRIGTELVFAADDDAFRRVVHARVTSVLARMLAGGAFAGPGAAQSYRVVVAPPGTSAGEGQVVVDVRVAPARPLRFLTVRLVRADGAVAVGETP